MDIPAATLLRFSSVPFVGHEMFESGEQVGTKAASFARYFAQIILFQKTREELLREIFGLMGVMPSPSYVSVKGIPIGAA